MILVYISLLLMSENNTKACIGDMFHQGFWLDATSPSYLCVWGGGTLCVDIALCHINTCLKGSILLILTVSHTTHVSSHTHRLTNHSCELSYSPSHKPLMCALILTVSQTTHVSSHTHRLTNHSCELSYPPSHKSLM